MSDAEECPHGAPCECDLLATIERLKGEWMNLPPSQESTQPSDPDERFYPWGDVDE